jgi:hypothetical protein
MVYEKDLKKIYRLSSEAFFIGSKWCMMQYFSLLVFFQNREDFFLHTIYLYRWASMSLKWCAVALPLEGMKPGA